MKHTVAPSDRRTNIFYGTARIRVMAKTARPACLEPSRANSAQMTRAFLFATATQVLVVPSLRCFSVIHRLRLSCLVGARYTTDLAPWINSMRKYGSPRLVIPKCRCLSPLECCLGTSPTHAANCRPLWKVRPSAIAATTARLQ